MARPSAIKVMGILLWHHFCYYKRHRVQLILNIFLPVVLAGGIGWLVRKVDPDVSDPVRTEKQWLLPHAVDDMKKQTERLRFELRQAEEKFNNSELLEKCQGIFGAPNQNPYITPISEKDRKILGCMNHMKNIAKLSSMRSGFSFFGITFPPPELKYPPSFTRGSTELGLMLMGTILYYPNTSFAEEIAVGMRMQLDPLFKIPGIYVEKSGGFINDTEVKNCFEDPNGRVVGFKTADEARNYLQADLVPSESLKPFCFPIELPMLWGIVDFTEFTMKKPTYTIVQDSRVRGYLDKRGLQLQSIVDTAIISVFTNGSHNENITNIELTRLPEKCWERPNQYVLQVMDTFLSLLVIMGFVVFSLNCIELMVTEKSLRLREFMAIMGVSTSFLKASWACFYLIYLVVASAVTTVVLAWALGPLLQKDTNFTVVYVIILAFNLSRLAYSFLFAAILMKPKSISTLVTSIDTIFWMLCIFVFADIRFLNGSRLLLAQVASVHYVVPVSIATFYFSGWAQKGIALDFEHLFMSPQISDRYGGLGMCFIYLAADAILYIVLSWYIEKVFPGEFGQKHSPLFFLNISYWSPPTVKSATVAPGIGNGKSSPSPLFDESVGITIRGLNKVYPNGFCALKNFREQFQPHQITAFLGKNGAGKSTTMNMMVGLSNMTSGEIRFGDLNLSSHLPQIREKMGFVPQYDILYPDLTLTEHVKFYGWLRGISTTEIKRELESQLQRMGLSTAQNTTATKLSGGQKRKLSIMIAYFGSPEYVILDEPTSGVDPFSARNIWDLILENRRTATTLLSTHQMDEADLLADWITIIDSGELKCSGTPLALKDKFGQGFRVIISTGTAGAKEINAVKELMKEKMDLDIDQINLEGKDIVCKIPTAKVGTSSVVTSLQALELAIEDINKGMSYGVTEPSLEEVFFNATSIATNKYPRAEKSASTIKHIKINAFSALIQQFKAQAAKRFWQTMASWNMLAYQIVLPLVFVVLMLLIGDNINNRYAGVSYQIDVRVPYLRNMWFLVGPETPFTKRFAATLTGDGIGLLPDNNQDDLSNRDQSQSLFISAPATFDQNFSNCSCESFCSEEIGENARAVSKLNLLHNEVIFGGNGIADGDDWIVKLDSIPEKIAGGFNFSGSEANLKILLYAEKDSFPQVLNAFHNVLLRAIVGNSDLEINYKVKTQLLTKLDGTREFFGNILQDLLQIMFIIFALTYATKGITIFIMTEKQSGLKKLQFLANANRFAYWLTNLLWDGTCYMFTVLLLSSVLYAVKNPFSDFVFYLMPVIIPYGWLMTSFVYLLSMVFKKTSNVATLIEVLGFVFFLASSALAVFDNFSRMMCVPTACKVPAYMFDMSESYLGNCTVDCDTVMEDFSFAHTLSPALRVVPLHFLVEGLMTTALMTFAVRTSQQLILQVKGHQSEINECLEIMYGPNLLSMEYFGQYVVYGALFTVIYISLVITFESFMPKGILSCLGSRKSESSKNEVIPVDTDPDVKMEEDKALALSGKSGVPLAVQNISKRFKSMSVPAVNNVSFAIPSAEIFGLLGVNGAGKSTTFKILSGYEAPNSGRCLIGGHDVHRNMIAAEKSMMYCPQENILADGISVYRHLLAFSGFLGVCDRIREEIVETLIDEVGLTQYKDRHVDKLSGGNKRKVQLAIALVGYPPLIFLDEPTTGMDPTARRLAWDAISRAVARGSAVVLTSHSMEECEILCHRLVIMVAGKLRCIGSLQYLKDKLGNRYTFKVRVEKPNLDDAQGIKELIYSKFGKTAMLMEEHATVLHYEIDAADLKKLSFLFEVMIECQQKFPVRNFTVSQVTLDQVFVNMAKEGSEAKYRQES